jgi:hypothetical protein
MSIGLGSLGLYLPAIRAGRVSPGGDKPSPEI